MTVLEQTSERLVLRQRTLFAAVVSFLAMTQFLSLAWSLWRSDAPLQQTLLMLALGVLLAYLFVNSAREVTLTLDTARRELRWRQRSLFGVREERFDLDELAEVRVDVRPSLRRGRPDRHRPELHFREHLARDPFPLSPHHIAGPSAQSVADAINPMLAAAAPA